MMADIFEEEKSNKNRKNKKKDLSKSETFGANIFSNRLSSDMDDSDYLDDLLNHAKGAVFITGNDNRKRNGQNSVNKKSVKKKKLRADNSYYIMNGIVNQINNEEERKDREEKERKDREERERNEKERRERENREREEKVERDRKEVERKDRKERKEIERIGNQNKVKSPKNIIKKLKIQIQKEEINEKKGEKEYEYSESTFQIATQSSGEKSDSKNNITESDYNSALKESINETQIKDKSINSTENEEQQKDSITLQENAERINVTVEESEITEKISENNIKSINDSNEKQNQNEESEEESEELEESEEETEENEESEDEEEEDELEESEKEESEKQENEEEEKEEEEEIEEEEIKEEEKFKFRNEPKIKTNKIKKNLKEQLEKFEFEQKMIVYKKFNNLIEKKINKEINDILKILYIFLRIKNNQLKSIAKISSFYRGYSFRYKFKIEYLTFKILKLREEYASKIASYYKMVLMYRQTKKLLRRMKNNYVIYSSLSNNNQLYFKYKYQNGSDSNLYFEYCPILKCFILFINKSEKMIKTVVEGCFYNENYNVLIDPLYEQNNRGENIINFPKIFKILDSSHEEKDSIINRYIKMHSPVKRRRERIDDYEERKRKVLDDDHLSHSQTFKIGKYGEKIKKISRSKSFMIIKGSMRSILKPSKSFLNLRCQDKKIQFGSARIKRYHNLKK